MKDLGKYIDKYIFLIALVVTIPAFWALLVKGFFGASDDIHIAWLFEMDRALRSGQFPPRFVPDLSYAFGYPLFNFVFPLPFYIGEIFHLLSFSFVDSIKLLFLLSFPLSFYLMYKLIRNYASWELSLAGAMLYVYTPYRATDVYVRGALGESVAFIFLPLILFALGKLLNVSENRKFRYIGIGAISTGLLILTHNIVSYMFLPAVMIFLLFHFLTNKNIKTLYSAFLAIIGGLSLSIYFWMPAILDSNIMKYDTVFNYFDHFPTLKQLVTPFFGYGASVPGSYDGMSFFMGAVNIFIIVLSLIYVFFRKEKIEVKSKITFFWCVFVFMASIFMMNYRSSFFWDIVPLIKYFQFPWRFLTLITFITPLMLIVFNKFRYKKILSFAVIIFSLALNFSDYKPHDFLGRTDDYFINRYIPFPSVSAEYKNTQEEYLRLPNSTITRPDKLYPPVFGNNINIVSGGFSGSNLAVQVDNLVGTLVSINKYNFPGWIVKVDGGNVALSSGNPFGQISFELPAGRHTIQAEFKETPLKLLLDFVSLISLLLLASVSLNIIKTDK
jgi:hypothetical protein